MSCRVRIRTQSCHSKPSRLASHPARPRLYGPTSEMSTSRHKAVGQEVGKVRSNRGQGWRAWLLPGLPVSGLAGRRREVLAGVERAGPGRYLAGRLQDRCLRRPAKWTTPDGRTLFGNSVHSSLPHITDHHPPPVKSLALVCIRSLSPVVYQLRASPVCRAWAPWQLRMELRAPCKGGPCERDQPAGSLPAEFWSRGASLPPSHVNKILFCPGGLMRIWQLCLSSAVACRSG